VPLERACDGKGGLLTFTPLTETVDRPRRHWGRELAGAIVLVVAAWLLLTQVIFTGDSDKSAQVRQAAGASWCEQSGYQLLSHLDGSKTTVYDCGFPHGRERCVTMSGGITRDATEEVRLLFASTIGAAKPGCLG